MTLKIATFNVNGINGRLANILEWLRRESPDIVCLQELKAADSGFPEAAIRAAALMGLEIAGVDMLEGKQGPRILEINSSPGLEGIERASGIDVAAAIVDHAELFARARAAHRRVVARRGKATTDAGFAKRLDG